MLSSLDPIKIGRATALLFLTDPDAALLVLIRAVTAVRDKANVVERRDLAVHTHTPPRSPRSPRSPRGIAHPPPSSRNAKVRIHASSHAPEHGPPSIERSTCLLRGSCLA